MTLNITTFSRMTLGKTGFNETLSIISFNRMALSIPTFSRMALR